MPRSAVILGLLVALTGSSGPAGFHTSPYCWDAPRIYAEHGADRYAATIERFNARLPAGATLSPNKAYAYYLADGDGAGSETSDIHLLVFNERPYLLQITFVNPKSVNEIRWVNENLLYARVWRGRIAASDFIIDVESESILYQQSYVYGAIAFEQFKQCSRPEDSQSDQCQCVHTDSVADDSEMTTIDATDDQQE